MSIVSLSKSKKKKMLKNREINYNFMAKNSDQFCFFFHLLSLIIILNYKLITFRKKIHCLKVFVGLVLDGVSPSVFRCTSTPMETGPIDACVET